MILTFVYIITFKSRAKDWHSREFLSPYHYKHTLNSNDSENNENKCRKCRQTITCIQHFSKMITKLLGFTVTMEQLFSNISSAE